MGVKYAEIIRQRATDPHKASLAMSHWLMYCYLRFIGLIFFCCTVSVAVQIASFVFFPVLRYVKIESFRVVIF